MTISVNKTWDRLLVTDVNVSMVAEGKNVPFTNCSESACVEHTDDSLFVNV